MTVVLPNHRSITRVSTLRYGRHWDVNKVLPTPMPFRWVADPEPDSLATVGRRYAAAARRLRIGVAVLWQIVVGVGTAGVAIWLTRH